MAALLLAGACCGFTACDDDDNNDGGYTPPPTSETDLVTGEYDGTMGVVEAAPLAAAAEEPAGTELSATVTGEEVQFEDFPIRDLVVRIVGEEGADEIVAAVGKVTYAVPYTAAANEDESAVAMALKPEPLKLTISEGGEEPQTASGTPALEIEVSISAAVNGTYTVESGELGFMLAVNEVKVGGAPLEEFEAFPLDFDLTKNKE